MFIMLFLKCIFIVFVIEYAKSNGFKIENKLNLKRIIRAIVEPSSDLSIPVAVFYDENDSQEKIEETVVSTTEFDNQEESIIITSLPTDIPTETTTNRILRAQFRVSDEVDAITSSEDELTIPVAVIYDEEPKNIVSTTNTPTLTKSNNRQQRIRKPVSKPIEENPDKEKKYIPQEKNSESIYHFTKRTQERDPIVPIIQQDNYVFAHSGDFRYSYEGGDGTKAFMRGELRSLDDDNAGEAVEGSFSYIGKDGNDYSLTYTADENGYRPVGAHLPTPPPIPPEIARALRYLATKTTPQPVTEPL